MFERISLFVLSLVAVLAGVGCLGSGGNAETDATGSGDAGLADGEAASTCWRSRKAHDENGDGTPERIVVSESDPLRFRVRSQHYLAGTTEGEPDGRETFQYDELDRLVRTEFDGRRTKRIDEAPDGTIDSRTSYTFEGANVVRETLDTNGAGPSNGRPDGEPDEITTFEYEDGNQVRVETDGFASPKEQVDPVDDVPDSITVYEYDGDRRTRMDWYASETTDGKPEARWTYEHDEAGRIERIEVDDGIQSPGGYEIDGRIDEVRTHEYDKRGNLVRVEVYTTKRQNGWTSDPPDETYTFEYTCS